LAEYVIGHLDPPDQKRRALLTPRRGYWLGWCHGHGQAAASSGEPARQTRFQAQEKYLAGPLQRGGRVRSTAARRAAHAVASRIPIPFFRLTATAGISGGGTRAVHSGARAQYLNVLCAWLQGEAVCEQQNI